jgi:hypothetical protein
LIAEPDFCVSQTCVGWTFSFIGKKRGRWRSPDDAALAVARHQTRLSQWDECREPVSEDLIDWRPVGDEI